MHYNYLDQIDIHHSDELINNEKRRNDMLIYAAKNGRFEMIKYIESLPLKDSLDFRCAIPDAPLSNNIELLKYIIHRVSPEYFSRLYIDTLQTINNIALVGRIDMLEFIMDYCNIGVEYIIEFHVVAILLNAIKGGQFDFIKHYYHDDEVINRIRLTCSKALLITECVKYNQFQIMKYLHLVKLGKASNSAYDHACSNGNLEMLQWLHENVTHECNASAMMFAATNNHFEIVKWLHTNRTESMSSKYTMDGAAASGHLEVVIWLHENRTDGCTSDAMDRASVNGKLEVVKWLHLNRTEGCTTDAMDGAAMHGNLEIVKWLHFNRTEGCTVDAMNYATGYIDVLKWLHENRTEGCTNSAIAIANLKKNYEAIKWFKDNRSELSHLDLAKYLLK